VNVAMATAGGGEFGGVERAHQGRLSLIFVG
jgi:hypothetical protein